MFARSICAGDRFRPIASGNARQKYSHFRPSPSGSVTRDGTRSQTKLNAF